MTEQFVAHLGYFGIALLLILGGLGLPVPEEAPIILAAVLSRSGKMLAPFALATCLAGVLIGDFIVYFLGYYYGEKVLSLPFTRRLLTRAREAQIKGYFHRHGFKILIFGRFAVGFRTAAYLTAGILKLPPLKLLLTDLVAASLTTFLMFGLGYVFAHQIQSGIQEVQQWVAIAIAVGVVILIGYRFYVGRKRAGLPVGPPVLYEEAPLPPDDLTAEAAGAHPVSEPAPASAMSPASTTEQPDVLVAAPASEIVVNTQEPHSTPVREPSLPTSSEILKPAPVASPSMNGQQIETTTPAKSHHPRRTDSSTEVRASERL